MQHICLSLFASLQKGCTGGTLHKSQPTFGRPPPHCLTRPLLTYLWLEQRLNSSRSFMLPVIRALLKYPKTNHTHSIHAEPAARFI